MPMTFDTITLLREASPDERLSLLTDRYEKNRRFFKKKFPGVDSFIERTPCPYRIDITETFLDIVDTVSGRPVHEGVALDRLAEAMGDWTHQAWLDLVDFNLGVNERYPLHHRIVQPFLAGMADACPKAVDNLNRGRLNLKTLEEDRRFSPPVIFLGIFHGLHIGRYLARTEMTSAMFIEPEPARFEVSCYFLDYEAIEQRFGELNIYCGSEPRSFLIKRFFSSYFITRHIWLRILPGYESTFFPVFVENIEVLFRAQSYSGVPMDRELAGLRNGLRNIKAGKKILSNRIRPLSRGASVAVVASGPSLDNDLEWLARNRENLILFAVHSSVRALRKHGIRPDFQFSLEMDKGGEVVANLQLYRDVPLISYYKTGSAFDEAVTELFLCAERFKSNPIRFTTSLEDTHPSTTNLAFSLACFLRPATIYLLGCDFGSPEGGASHAGGTAQREQQEKEGGADHGPRPQSFLVPASFRETSKIATNPFLNRARIGVERAIEKSGGVKVINLSNGAGISGAQPAHSCETAAEKYKGKEKDIENIRRAFQAARKNGNWKPYSETGAQALQRLKRSILANLRMEGDFSWKSFARAMDKAVELAMYEYGRRSLDDLRMEMFLQLFADIFAIWYSFFILSDEKGDAEEVYKKGFELLGEVFEQIHWPAELEPA